MVGVAGLIATPARAPDCFTICTARCRWRVASTWTVTIDAPASANACSCRSGSRIIRCTSSGSRGRAADARRRPSVPSVMLGTNWPSMTSTWMKSAPAGSASRTCSPIRAKSAVRIDGASLTLRHGHPQTRDGRLGRLRRSPSWPSGRLERCAANPSTAPRRRASCVEHRPGAVPP